MSHTGTSVTAEYEARAKRGTTQLTYKDAFMVGAMSVELADLRNELARLRERLSAAEHRLVMQDQE